LVYVLSPYHQLRSYEDAKNNPGWVKVVNKETKVLMIDNTWDFVELPIAK